MPDDCMECSDRNVLVARDVSVNYRIGGGFDALRSRFVGGAQSTRTVEALKGVSLTLAEGESLGLLGANGSGKSTLLRCLAGLHPVDGGVVRARTRPVLLGVGAVLKPGLSGRRNILLGCLALGLTRREALALQSDIIDFSGLSDSVDRPLHTYSSGMRARLHFSIASATQPDILMIDEALAVGDEEFRERCKVRLRELRQRAGGVVLVTHSLAEISSSCTRAVWLKGGKVVGEGEPDWVIGEYKRAVETDDAIKFGGHG